MQGYTEVWGGPAEQLLAVAQQWQSLVGSDKLMTVPNDRPGYLGLWIANECIDWQYYRDNDEYVLLGTKTKRSGRKTRGVEQRSDEMSQGNLNDELGN